VPLFIAKSAEAVPWAMTDDAQKHCEHCNQPIPEDAILCLYCGEGVRVDSGFLGTLKHSMWGWLAGVISLVVLASFLVHYVF